MTAGLEARRTVAAAVVADYHRALKAANDSREITWSHWAQKLALAVESLLAEPGPHAQLGAEAAVQQLASIRNVLGAFDWETGDRQYALEWIARIAGAPVRSMPATFVRPDESASLARQDRLTVLGAIAIAAEYLESRAGLVCGDCEADVAEICDTYASDLDAAAEYRAVAERLGEDRT